VDIVDSMVVKFYAETHKPMYWFPAADQNMFASLTAWFSPDKGLQRAKEWLSCIESAEQTGVPADVEQIKALRNVLEQKIPVDVGAQTKTDAQITSLVLHFMKTLHEGDCTFAYDQITTDNDRLYITRLLNAGFRSPVKDIVSSLECTDHDYGVYARYFRDSLQPGDTLKRKTILGAMQYRRFLSVYQGAEYVLINIPQQEAAYVRNNVPVMNMRVVLGKPRTPTPTIASYIASITTFPQWNVPRGIAVEEMLPKVQKDENYLEQNNFEVVDAQGRAVEESELNWRDYTAQNFPYYFRQESGPDNALGLLKFNLQNPFSIFLHGTSNQGAFSRESRFLSHGCIRLENPYALADSLLRGKLDVGALKGDTDEKEPAIRALPNKIPVFIIYQPVKIEGDSVLFLKDEYGLIQ